jgi:hypothetical protein
MCHFKILLLLKNYLLGAIIFQNVGIIYEKEEFGKYTKKVTFMKKVTVRKLNK